MTALELLERLDGLLAEEREAIQVLDGETVSALADEKSRILEKLNGCKAELREERLAPAVEIVVAGLRRNGVLLAHARSCLRDFVGALKSEHEGHISIRG